MIKIRLNRQNIFPTKKTLVNIVFVVMSIVLIQYIFELLSIKIIIEGYPKILELFITIGLALYLKSILDVQAFGRDWL